jgi:hypothetical protein
VNIDNPQQSTDRDLVTVEPPKEGPLISYFRVAWEVASHLHREDLNTSNSIPPHLELLSPFGPMQVDRTQFRGSHFEFGYAFAQLPHEISAIFAEDLTRVVRRSTLSRQKVEEIPRPTDLIWPPRRCLEAGLLATLC